MVSLRRAGCAALLLALGMTARAAEPDWNALDRETLQRFQDLLRIDTSNPPGNETVLANHLAELLRSEGIDVQLVSNDPQRASLIARLQGNGSKQPLLLMSHLDVVTVDASKWNFPPFGAVIDNGWIYGRGAIDDRDNMVASLMALLVLKRSGVALDRDVIFLAEAAEESGASDFGIDFVVKEHFAAIDAEYCLAEGSTVTRANGKPLYVGVQAGEKKRRTAILTANGISGHASVPLRTNPVISLSKAVAAVAEWQGPLQLSDATTSFLSRLADVSPPENAARYRALLNPSSQAAQDAMEYLLNNEPTTATLLHNTITPTIVDIGYRFNVIPSQGTATLDVRLLPDQDFDEFLDTIKGIVNDPAIDVHWDNPMQQANTPVRINTEAYQVIEQVYGEHYGVPVLPTMGAGATDMTALRAKGIACYGVGPGVDREDASLGYGMHSDQERLSEAELYNFVHTYYEIVERLAATP